MGWWLFPAAAMAAAVLLVVALMGMPGNTSASGQGAQVMDIEAGANYDYSLTLPSSDDDFLIIDVTSAE